MNDLTKKTIEIAKKIQNEPAIQYIPPSEGSFPKSQMVITHSIVKNTRGYIEKISCQINGCYENGWYDACAVMMRRFIETLIIETFEYYRLANKIKDSKGDFLSLKDLISATINEKSWNLSRNAKKGLQKLKGIGDRSAHSRRFIAHREDIDKVQNYFRDIFQELIYLANLKK